MNRPYVIVAPNYTRTSAGIKALHLLCHHLNLKGYQAFITASIPNPALITPQLSKWVIEYWNENRIAPIVIYSETISGNPMNADTVVRYLMNFPGHLGGDLHFPENEFVISWATGMNHQAPPSKEFVLYIPTVDQSVFYPPDKASKRSGSCYYWEKYKYFHKGSLSHPDPSSIEIRRSGSYVQTPQEIAEIFRTKEVFYCYENSMLSLEAMLCGCPVVLVPNEHFESVICDKDLGMDGMTIGFSQEGLEAAKATVGRVPANYEKYIATFKNRLMEFVKTSQSLKSENPHFNINYYELEPIPYNFAARLISVVMLVLFLLRSGDLNNLAQLLKLLLRFDWGHFKHQFLGLYRVHKGEISKSLRM